METERGKLRNMEFPGRYGRNPTGQRARGRSRLTTIAKSCGFQRLLVEAISHSRASIAGHCVMLADFCYAAATKRSASVTEDHTGDSAPCCSNSMIHR
jgi:hypothetical protein